MEKHVQKSKLPISIVLKKSPKSVVKSITNYFCSKSKGRGEFFAKILSFNNCTLSEDDINGETVINNEFTVLKNINGRHGIIRLVGLFKVLRNDKNGALNLKKIDKVDSPQHSLSFLLGRCRLESIKPNKENYTRQYCLLVQYPPKSKTLQQYVLEKKRLSQSEALLIFSKILEIVVDIHSINLVHQDIKLANVLITPKNDIYFINFLFSKFIVDDNTLFGTSGSPAYISPEVLNQETNPIGYKGRPRDIWALGVVLFIMLYGEFPFVDTHPRPLFTKIKNGNFHFPPNDDVCDDTKKLICEMLTVCPEQRPTAEQILVKVNHLQKKGFEK